MATGGGLCGDCTITVQATQWNKVATIPSIVVGSFKREFANRRVFSRRDPPSNPPERVARSPKRHKFHPKTQKKAQWAFQNKTEKLKSLLFQSVILVAVGVDVDRQ